MNSGGVDPAGGDNDDGSRIGGVVFRVFGTDSLCFLPSSIARKVTPIPEMAHIPGAPLELRGVALVDGDMIPIVEVVAEGYVAQRSNQGYGVKPHREGGEPTGRSAISTRNADGRAMLVCAVLGECVGLVGIDVLATGFFDIEKDASVLSSVGSGSGAADKVHVRVPSASGAIERAATFDVVGVIARVREGRWAV